MTLVTLLLILFLWSHPHETSFHQRQEIPQTVPQHCVPRSLEKFPTVSPPRWHPAVTPSCPASTR